jgi:hypothetical protein
MMRPSNSRQLARTWPYPRYQRFVDEVRRSAAAWFSSKGYKVHPKYPYILAEWGDWPKNIILPDVSSFILATAERQRTEGSPFPLHKYLHHGLSSQALLFNLVGPLLVADDLGPIKSLLQRLGVTWPGTGATAILEYEDRAVFNEDTGQPTSIDLAISDASGKPCVFVEAKFVEQKFGGCSVYGAADCDGMNPSQDLGACYLHHVGRTYWRSMQHFGLIEGPIRSDATCIMANHYQFFRELLFALEKGGVFVLLSDDRSPAFRCKGPGGDRGLMPLLLGLLPERTRAQVGHASMQALVREIALSGRHGWVADFIAKYGPRHSL